MDCPFEAEYLDHKLLYHSDGGRRVLVGSLLAAIMAAMVECFRESVDSGTSDRRPAVRSCSRMVSLFMLHGIDFEGAEFQHLWMDYDEDGRRWNVHEFPYSVSTARRELKFLQRVCTKALRRHPAMVLAVVCWEFRGFFLEENDHFESVRVCLGDGCSELWGHGLAQCAAARNAKSVGSV